jgi:hypothetical protein
MLSMPPTVLCSSGFGRPAKSRCIRGAAGLIEMPSHTLNT